MAVHARSGEILAERLDHEAGTALSAAQALGVYASALALISALLFVARAATRISVMSVFADVSRDVLWMSPVANLAWYALAWAVLAVAARILGDERGLVFGVWGLTATFVLSPLLTVTAIHRLAALVFAAGLATVLVRVHARSPAAWLRRARTTRNMLAAGFLVANLLMAGGSALARSRESRTVSTPAPGAPNVVLLILDTMRGDALRSAGYQRNVMPFVDSLAASGAYFPWAYATTSWSLPSHGTMVTGEYPGQLNTTVTRPLDRSFRTLGEVFAEKGFYTAGFTANLHFTSWESGINQGFREWHDYRRSLRQVLRSSLIGEIQMLIEISDATSWSDVRTALRRHQIMVYPKPVQDTPVATEMTDRYLAWYDRKTSGPYLAFVNFIDAHLPYTPHAKYRGRFGEPHSQRDLYDAELAYLDDELRRLFAELQRRGGLENTYVVITADHGEQFGEHGLTGHANSVYSATLHVPLIVLGPGISPQRIEHAVSLRDLPATILGLAGVSVDLPGASLTGYLTDSSFRASPVLAELATDTASWHSYLDDEFQLVQRPKSEELYRYRIDPRETNDLAHADSMQPVLIRLRAEMARAFAAQAAPSPSAPGKRPLTR